MTETPETQAPTEGQEPEAGQAAGTGQGSTENNNPFSGFEGEDLGYIQNKGWDKEDGIKQMFNSYRNLEGMRGVPEDRLLKIPEGEDGWEDVYKRLGKPDDVSGYDFTPPEGMEIDQDRMDWFSKTAHELNLNKQQHNKMIESANEYESNILRAQEEKLSQERTIELDKLKDAWGNAYDERITLGKRAVRAFVDDESTIDKLEDAMGSNAAVIRLFAKLGETISEDKLPAAESDRKFGYSKEQIELDIKTLKEEIKGDPTRIANFNKGQGPDVEKLARLRKVLNG